MENSSQSNLQQRNAVLTGLQLRLRKNPQDAATWVEYGQRLFEIGRRSEAERALKTALKSAPDYGRAVVALADVYRATGQVDKAIEYYHRALEMLPGDAGPAFSLGFLLHTLKRTEAAAEAYREALRRQPGLVAAHINLGAALIALNDLTGARSCYETALSLQPDNPEARYNLGRIATLLGDSTTAEQCFRHVLAMQPRHVESNLGLATLLTNAHRDLSTITRCCVNVLEVEPNNVVANRLVGINFGRTGNHAKAAQYCRKAYQDSGKTDSLAAMNLAFALAAQAAGRETVDELEALLADAPESGTRLLALMGAKTSGCDWEGLGPLIERFLGKLNAGVEVRIAPFNALGIPGINPLQHRHIAERYVHSAIDTFTVSAPALSMPAVKAVKRRVPRIGYISADFRQHPVGNLVVGILEKHDPAQFEVHAFSLGADDGSQIRQRVQSAVSRFHDIAGQEDRAIAEYIRDREIDILIDLAGHTHGARLNVLALRPAAIIVNWLGYPGTMGLPRLADYIIGDRFVTPRAHADHFSETIAQLPHSYFPAVAVPELSVTPSRSAAGLPERGIIFCSFNQGYKITRDVFDVWCRLLNAVPDSVLWLPQLSDFIQSNLRTEADRRGVAPGRLIFAPRLPDQRDHLARLQLADIALDTFPYNSHSTGMDALLAGVPLVNCTGAAFTARVGASLLTAVGLEECVTHDLDAYYQLALSLAQDAHKRQGMRQRLLASRNTAALFDPDGFARDYEHLLLEIWSQHVSGIKEGIFVA